MSEAIGDNAGIHMMVGFRGLEFGGELREFIEKLKIGGIVLFRRNVEGPEQLRTLIEEAQAFAQATLGRPLLIAIDQEGGPVQRLTPHFTSLPSAHDLAALGSGAVARWAAVAAADLRQLGIQINLAPVLDVVRGGEQKEGQPGKDRSHFMEARSLGTDPRHVANVGKIWIETLQGNGVSATAKHYPGLGSAESDPHHFAPVIRWPDEASMQRDLLPFAEAIRAGVHCVMTSHALYPFLDPEWPATLSAIVNRQWLREKLGFDGVLFSDDMDMAAVSGRFSWNDMIRHGLLSSIDFFLLCQVQENVEPFHHALTRSFSTDPVLAQAHRQSAERIATLFKRHAPRGDTSVA